MKKKIPDNARLVFKGVLHHVYHWDQEMFDGSVATFEAIKRNDAVTVIAVVDNKIIINNEEQPGRAPFKALPGGMSEDGTDMLTNAKRELLEETGYASDDWELWFVSDILGAAKIEWNNHFYIARNCKKVAEQSLDAGEKIETTLVTFDEFIEFRNNPKARNKDLFPYLEKAATDDVAKQTLQTLLGITP